MKDHPFIRTPFAPRRMEPCFCFSGSPGHYSYRPRAGALVYFPSDSRYAHRALPVTSGVRYVIASWAAFRGAPRVHDTAPAYNVPLAPDASDD